MYTIVKDVKGREIVAKIGDVVYEDKVKYNFSYTRGKYGKKVTTWHLATLEEIDSFIEYKNRGDGVLKVIEVKEAITLVASGNAR